MPEGQSPSTPHMVATCAAGTRVCTWRYAFPHAPARRTGAVSHRVQYEFRRAVCRYTRVAATASAKYPKRARRKCDGAKYAPTENRTTQRNKHRHTRSQGGATRFLNITNNTIRQTKSTHRDGVRTHQPASPSTPPRADRTSLAAGIAYRKGVGHAYGRTHCRNK